MPADEPKRPISPFRGGRRAALDALARVDPGRYARTRNYLGGDVTRLSPYLRHGVLSMAEVRDAARHAGDAAKLLNELAWRDYFRRIYDRIGDGVWDDLEPSKAGLEPSDYADEMPADVVEGATGLACIDAFSRDLADIGYLHNHARMWLAAYLVHWRRVAWPAGAEWFLYHLLDGDPASNNLSWQWVAGTFSNKPYIFNRENLERHTDGVYCRRCPLRGRCDFEGSYEDLGARLFADAGSTAGGARSTDLDGPTPNAPLPRPAGVGPAIVWVHADDLNPAGPSLAANPGAPALFVWDEPALVASPWGPGRITFIEECLAELPVTVRRGDPAAIVPAFAAEHGARRVALTYSPDPRMKWLAKGFAATLTVEVIQPEPFVDLRREPDLGRFSRYWKSAEKALMARPRRG